MKIDKLTADQEAKLDFYKHKWLRKMFNNELFDRMTVDTIKKSMQELYNYCGLDTPPTVIVVDSPMACQLVANNLNWTQARDQVRSQVGDQVWSQVRSQVGSFVEFSSYINYSDFGRLSFYEFFHEELGLFDKPLSTNLRKVISFVEASFMSIQLNGLCIVSRYPKFISRNSENQLHNVNTHAIEFADGYGQHYFKDVYIPFELFNKLINKKYTFEDFTLEKNEEVKSVVLAFYEEKFGSEFVYNFISTYLSLVDTYVDKKQNKYLKNTTNSMNIGVYSLFSGKIGAISISYVRCYCPSTDRMFFLGVQDDFTNAKDAIASLCRVPVKLKDNLISINRQGEMFSFNFDKKGTQLLKSNTLTEGDFQNVVALSGDEYFNKIKFEY